MLQFFNSFLPQPQRGLLISILALFALDTLVAIAVAIKNHTFDPRVLPNQLKSIALFIGGLLAVQFTTTSFFQGADSGGSTATFVASATGCIAKLGADIWVKIGMLIGSGALGPVPMTVTGHDTPVAAGPAPTAPPLTA